ncbi:MAG: hypothetical protein WB793_13135 [Candidatus Dormiibacterota bacterium]
MHRDATPLSTRWAGMRAGTRPALRVSVGSGDATLLATVAIVLALMISAGSSNPAALLLLTIASALLIAARSMVAAEPSRAAWVAAIASCAIAFVFNADLFGGLEVVCAAAVVVGVVVALTWRFRCGVALVAAAAVAAATLPWHWGVGLFDVFRIETAAAQSLLHGGNPYSATIYDRVPIAPGVVVIGPEHLPYGPTVAAASLPGALVGDIRVASVLWAIAAAGAVLLVARQGLLSPASRRLLLVLTIAFPLIPSMVVTAWPETLMVATFGLSLALFRRHPVWMVVAIAACLLVKPTALVLFLPFFVWSPAWRLRIVAGSLLALAVMVICSIGVGIPALAFATLVRHFWEPVYYDGLTVGAVIHNLGGGPLPGWVFPAAVAAACLAVLRVRPRDTADLCVAAAFLFMVSTAFASYARFNFYYVAAAVLLFALGSRGVPLEPISRPTPRGVHAFGVAV